METETAILLADKLSIQLLDYASSLNAEIHWM